MAHYLIIFLFFPKEFISYGEHHEKSDKLLFTSMFCSPAVLMQGVCHKVKLPTVRKIDCNIRDRIRINYIPCFHNYVKMNPNVTYITKKNDFF